MRTHAVRPEAVSLNGCLSPIRQDANGSWRREDRPFGSDRIGARSVSDTREESGITTSGLPRPRLDFDLARVAIPANPDRRIQPRLAVGASDDRFEKEADQVADRILRSHVMPESCGGRCGGTCGGCREQGSRAPADRIQTRRVGSRDSVSMEVGNLLDDMPLADNAPVPGSVPVTDASVADVLRSAGRALDRDTRVFMESRFGHDFGLVQIHADSRAAEAARSIGAHAFTFGPHVVFGAGQYQPSNAAGRWLLAHELTHTLQQTGPAGPRHIQRFLTCEPENECPDREPGEIGRSRRNAMELHEVTSGGTGRLLSNFGVDRADIRGDLTTNPDWPEFVRAVSTRSELTWEILGFSDCHGDEARNATLRAARARSLYLALPPEAQSQIDTYRGAPSDQCVRANTTEEQRGLNRSALVWLRTTTIGEDEFDPAEVRGIVCPCDASTEVDYDTETFSFLTSIEPLLRSIAGGRGVSIVAVAGAIADEFNTRRGLRVVLDDLQDAVIDALPEFSIDVDRFVDIHHKLLNTLENDVGPANINVRTALELVQSGELTVPGSPISDVQVNAIVDFLLTERGTVTATTSVIERAERLFGPHLTAHDDALRDAVLVEYFKQGDRYHDRFTAALAADPDHEVCPGDGGCRVMHNRDRIVESLSVHAGEGA